jgi:hypothetical protein
MIELLDRYQLTIAWVAYVLYVAGVFQFVGWVR